MRAAHPTRVLFHLQCTVYTHTLSSVVASSVRCVYIHFVCGTILYVIFLLLLILLCVRARVFVVTVWKQELFKYTIVCVCVFYEICPAQHRLTGPPAAAYNNNNNICMYMGDRGNSQIRPLCRVDTRITSCRLWGHVRVLWSQKK